MRRHCYWKKASSPNWGFSLIEFVVVVIIITVLAIVFLRYAEEVVEETEQVALKSLSQSFASTMRSLRGQWIVENSQQLADTMPAMVTLENQPVYLNEYHWPANTQASSDPGSGTQTAQECQQLWEVISKNPLPTTTDNEQRGERWVHISVVKKATPDDIYCRYELASTSEATHFFDYNLKTGRVVLNTPAHKQSD